MPKYFTVIILLFITVNVQAQTWEVGGMLGAAGYIGDLNTNNPFKPSGPQGGLFVKYNFNRYLAARLNVAIGQISGADSTSNIQQFRERNLSFKDQLREVSLMAEFNFMSYIPDAGKNKYTPYVFLGGGISSFAPRAVYNGEVYGLRQLRTEGQGSEYAQTAIVIPFGAGFKYNIGGKWTLGAEVGYRLTNTDYLDDVSDKYAAVTNLPSELAIRLADRSGEVNGGINIGTPGTQRGDLKSKDLYWFAGLTLSFTFVTSKCYY
ncbi:DUF6089 family protein [Mucilaginibacter litoreus]|uniref:DUF6089 family protein n=1 Tax=Mucilaginibacter litoreus TaxID=1048221 RepID=A0ABW3AP44_9SPHI